MPRPADPPAMKDPLLSAVIKHLPAAGPWPEHKERESWFEMMRKAFDVVYGPAAPSGPRLPGLGPALGATIPESAIGTVPAARFCVEPDGTASRNGRPIDPTDIPSGTVLHDYRVQPVDDEYSPIMWKTHGSKKMALPAGVLLRTATEPWAARSVNGSGEAMV